MVARGLPAAVGWQRGARPRKFARASLHTATEPGRGVGWPAAGLANFCGRVGGVLGCDQNS